MKKIITLVLMGIIMSSCSSVAPEENESNNNPVSDIVIEETVVVEESVNNIEEILTVENNPDLDYILNNADDFDAQKSFVEKYKGKKIKFDGNIAAINQHGSYKTRYDILIFAGDYSETSSRGAAFQIRDKSITYDLNLIGDNIPDTLSERTNITLIAEVEEYNEGGSLVILKPVETRIR